MARVKFPRTRDLMPVHNSANFSEACARSSEISGETSVDKVSVRISTKEFLTSMIRSCERVRHEKHLTRSNDEGEQNEVLRNDLV